MKGLKHFLLSLTFGLVAHSNAQTIAGGEIYYELISSKKYLVTANVYRPCNSNPLNSLSGFVIADTFKIPINFKRTLIQKINDTCGNPCNIQNTKSNAGFERHTFIDTVDLNSSPYDSIYKAGLCSVKFAIHQIGRDTLSTTIQKTNLFYLDAEVNTCLNYTQIHSPVFSFDPKFNLVCNQAMTYCPGPTDTLDFDSMSFSMDAPLIDWDQTVNYTGSYNQNIPMTPYCPPAPGVINCKALPNAKPPRGFYFDAEVCEIALTPNKCDEIAPVKIRITEWRKSNNTWVKIGYVTREMNVSVKQYTNNPSIIFSNSKYSICKNNSICFNIQSYDYPYGSQTVGDTSQMLWNYGIASATCKIVDPTAREKQMQFCWTPKKAGKQVFAVMAYDKLCNINSNSKGFSVNVKPIAENKRRFQYSNCSTLEMESFPTDTVNHLLSNYSYSFTIFPADTLSKVLFTSTLKKALFKIPYTGYFAIKHTLNNNGVNCPLTYWDTLYLVKNKINTPKKQLACLNDIIYLDAFYQTMNAVKYQWEYPFGTKKPTDTASTYVASLDKKQMKIALFITDKNTCTFRDTFEISARGAFELNRKSGNLCNTLTYNFSALNIKGSSPFIYDWYLNNKRVNTADSFINQNFKQNTKLVLQISDSTYCSFSDTLTLKPIAPPTFTLENDSSCLNTIIKISPKVASYPEKLIYDWTLDAGLSSKHDTSLIFTVTKTHTLNLNLRNAIGCNAQKTIQIYANPLPTFNILGNTSYNRYALVQLNLDKVLASYFWSNGTTNQDNVFWASSLGGPGSYTIWCKAKDYNGCENIQFKQIRTDQFTEVFENNLLQCQLYPNPSRNSIIINSNLDSEYQIQTLDGKTIQEGLLNMGTQSIDIHSLSPGIYIFQIGLNRIKFVKE
jgi:hypothetical protein